MKHQDNYTYNLIIIMQHVVMWLILENGQIEQCRLSQNTETEIFVSLSCYCRGAFYGPLML